MMYALGLDCSGRKVGWAVVDHVDDVLESGVNEFKSRRGEAVGLVYLRYRKWLDDAILVVRDLIGEEPLLLAYEQAHFRGGHAAEMAIAMQTRTQELAAAHGLVAVPCHTATVKKFATGRGNSGKPEMVSAAAEVLGREPKDDNEADAVHIARWALSEYGQRPETCGLRIGVGIHNDEVIVAWLSSDKDDAKIVEEMHCTARYFDLCGSAAAALDAVKEFWKEQDGES